MDILSKISKYCDKATMKTLMSISEKFKECIIKFNDICFVDIEVFHVPYYRSISFKNINNGFTTTARYNDHWEIPRVDDMLKKMYINNITHNNNYLIGFKNYLIKKNNLTIFNDN